MIGHDKNPLTHYQNDAKPRQLTNILMQHRPHQVKLNNSDSLISEDRNFGQIIKAIKAAHFSTQS